ncbi:MAG: redoxin domain-containing protein [Bryobacteraceae bacterium]|nr:redoxin domain-containing protein [Bryobacteraceae bacterium]
MRLGLLAAAGLVLPLCAQPRGEKPAWLEIKQGHSHLGPAFDTGPRHRPVDLKGIGQVHFPITTRNPEVQKWFNQGVTLLHSFWEYEAERAFRWCQKLEPENAMCYWGLARAAGEERSTEFIREAVKRKDKVSERERLYIEALEALNKVDRLRDRGDNYTERNGEYKKKLESLCVKYPDDMEARALLALANMGDSRYGTEQIVREILAKQPEHPGAHHYRIHNWNYHEPEQALESCVRYGKIAPGVGHAHHMPGHIYATVGMWHEAAIAMDAATRTELRYMQEHLKFPFNTWNYGHNRHYLSYIQEQLGMVEAAVFGARQLIDAPLDPQHNGEHPYSSHTQGLRSLVRTLVKYERWNELLNPKAIPWRDIAADKLWKAYVETRAHTALGNTGLAEKAFAAHQKLKEEGEKADKTLFEIQTLDLRARLALAAGETLPGLALLSDAAEKQFEMQSHDNDPPRYPEVLYNALGRAYLEAQSPALAGQAFEKALKLTRNDLFALAGLVESYQAVGEAEKAKSAMARLRFVTLGADKGLKPLERAAATKVEAEAKDESPRPQRIYTKATLEQYGPAVWAPYSAMELDAKDPDGKRVTLTDYQGKNVILVFYLGRECLHCMKQLQDISGRGDDWERLETVVLAVSGNKPAENAKYLKDGLKLGAVRLLSDEGFANARRFQSYDDFEEMEVHSTILIDKAGRVHWARSGGDPFTDMPFLVKQLERMNAAK